MATDFQFMWIWPFRRVHSVAFVFCTKFASNICYSHWDRRTYASEFHLMTLRELTSGFDFWSMVISAWSWCIFHIIWCKISLSSPKLLTFFRNPRWRPIFSLCEFDHTNVLIVQYLCSVLNLLQISVIVTEIDAHMLQFHLMTSRKLTSGFNFWSRGHLCLALVRLPMKFRADIFIQLLIFFQN